MPAAAVLSKAPTAIVTDSRQAGEGSLFLALRGERTDGHKFIPDVLQKGALAVLCEERGTAGEPRMVVLDTLAAMQQIAAASRKRWDIPFVGVTGSVGKTTAKEMLAAALSGKYGVFKTPGSTAAKESLPRGFAALQRTSGERTGAAIRRKRNWTKRHQRRKCRMKHFSHGNHSWSFCGKCRRLEATRAR